MGEERRGLSMGVTRKGKSWREMESERARDAGEGGAKCSGRAN